VKTSEVNLSDMTVVVTKSVDECNKKWINMTTRGTEGMNDMQ